MAKEESYICSTPVSKPSVRSELDKPTSSSINGRLKDVVM